ncbi:MAG: biosynthetic-type acetolactate synthase large subunit, partial [Firmicutes bacterium]|nr:biosynthetic-type acetolactate synthase large subunit [Bacillota bacterium]
RITGAQAVVKILEIEGIKVVFGYPGGAILPVYDALKDSNVEHVLVRNEQAAAHAASGYARVTGRAGVCIATSGPGATNLVTGIATAYMDSIPMIVITGQVPVAMIGRDVFQEIDITGATEPFTKHNYLIKSIKDIPRIFKEAFHIANTRRPGPVLIDIPKDVSTGVFDFQYPDECDLKGYKPTYHGNPSQIKRVVSAIAKAQRPLICVGGGGITANAALEILNFAEIIQAPVATTLMGIGSFPSSHSLSLGMLGGDHGVYPAKRAVEEADLLIVLGARMADRSTGNRNEFAKDARVVHIDIDPAEIGKNIDTDIPLVGDVKSVVEDLIMELSRGIELPNRDNWLESIAEWKNTRHGVGNNLAQLNPMDIIQTLSNLAGEDTIIVTDVGQHQMWAGRYYQVEKPRTFITSGGLGTMGYGLPAAIGAKMASPDKEVVLITGDGSFQMSLPEMATIMQQGLSIKIIMLNNNCLGMVRELQQHYHQERYYQVYVKGNPDFVALAKAYGFEALRVTKEDLIELEIKKILTYDGPILAEFMIDPSANVIPVKGGG